jgi:hypothetical protein
MDSRPIFNLIYASFGWEKYYYFYGPENSTVEQFGDLCDDLLPQAGYKAATKITHVDSNGWINWIDVVESLIPLLEQQGYQRFDLPKHVINGNGAIGINTSRRAMDDRLGFSTKLIANHNHALNDKLKKETSAQKSGKSKFRKFLPQIMK